MYVESDAEALKYLHKHIGEAHKFIDDDGKVLFDRSVNRPPPPWTRFKLVCEALDLDGLDELRKADLL